MNKDKQLLIIFYRNPELGKVKSRLAATVGEERALAIYLLMATHARNISLSIPMDKIVYYSAFIDSEDNWLNRDFQKRLQHGSDLGEKMKNAFEESFNSGYESVCIIGTDCLQLTEDILIMAFDTLKQHDAVVGPAADGGYYLLGMNRFVPELFNNKTWSTSSVCGDTIQDLKSLHCSYYLLPTLHDVDQESDLPPYLH
jgi:rSAM/selenodomain-associated transferase 1